MGYVLVCGGVLGSCSVYDILGGIYYISCEGVNARIRTQGSSAELISSLKGGVLWPRTQTLKGLRIRRVDEKTPAWTWGRNWDECGSICHGNLLKDWIILKKRSGTIASRRCSVESVKRLGTSSCRDDFGNDKSFPHKKKTMGSVILIGYIRKERYFHLLYTIPLVEFRYIQMFVFLT